MHKRKRLQLLWMPAIFVLTHTENTRRRDLSRLHSWRLCMHLDSEQVRHAKSATTAAHFTGDNCYSGHN